MVFIDVNTIAVDVFKAIYVGDIEKIVIKEVLG
jgi:hypothetical protein